MSILDLSLLYRQILWYIHPLVNGSGRQNSRRLSNSDSRAKLGQLAHHATAAESSVRGDLAVGDLRPQQAAAHKVLQVLLGLCRVQALEVRELDALGSRHEVEDAQVGVAVGFGQREVRRRRRHVAGLSAHLVDEQVERRVGWGVGAGGAIEDHAAIHEGRTLLLSLLVGKHQVCEMSDELELLRVDDFMLRAAVF